MAESMPKGRTFSVSGVLKTLGVSTSGYYDWIKREPSIQEIRREEIKKKIKEIYNESHSIYGAPKITRKLIDSGEKISERTVTTYMQQMGIKACYVKHRTVTTISVDFSDRLKNILKRD